MAASPSSLDKSLALLVRVMEDGGSASLSTLARAVRLPSATTHRLLGGLERAGLVARLGRSHYVGGPTLSRLSALQLSPRELLAEAARPVLAELSRRTRRITHLGILEDSMMTYLLKEGDPEHRIMSKPGMQLEAYCSGVGKALLAHLPQAEREAYLSTAPFVALTPTTIISADALRDAFDQIRAQGYALDSGEMFERITCIAVPVRAGGRAVAAISLIATHVAEPCRPVAYLARLHAAVAQIEDRLANVAEMVAPPC